jgi:HD-GYP domain-containing protein (c-di-GMP phosphodiesterase class II)
MVAQHHEWFDGSSYSAGLAGENQFCMRAFLQLQIAMTRSFLIDPTEKAFPSDKQKSETQFDPTVIEVFERLASLREQGKYATKILPRTALQSERT